MTSDASAAGDSPVTREEWRALRRIRRLQLISTLSFAGAFAGLLIQVAGLMREFGTTAQTGRLHEMPLVDFGGFAIFCAALACDGIVGGILGRTICPRCGHEYFRNSSQGELGARRRRRSKPSLLSRLTGVRGQFCRNCQLSLGLTALPEPREKD
jgi:hypothetical protein